jgi:hypothetical protein
MPNGPGKEWRLKADSLYGAEVSNRALTRNVESWVGDFEPVNLGLRPWVSLENCKETGLQRYPIVFPPRYDTNP